MSVSESDLTRLFEESCQRQRISHQQSDDAILRESRRRLARCPDDVVARYVVATASLRDRRPDHSLTLLTQLPEALADDAMGHRIAGYACMVQQQPEAARRHFDKAIRLDPQLPDCWTILGRIAEDFGHHEGAIEYYQRAMIFDDTLHVSALALSDLHVRNRNLKEAIHTLRVSLLRDRRSARLNLALAKLLERQARLLGQKKRRRAQQRILDEACRCYQTANSAAPDAVSHVSHGILQQKRERFSEARLSFQKAVELDPECPVAISHLANANVENGTIDQALEQFERSINIAPHRAATHFRYSRAKRFKPSPETEAYVNDLRRLVVDSDRPVHERVQLHFALAKVLDDIGENDEAWQHYDRANRLKPGHTESVAKRRSARGLEPLKRFPLRNVTDRACRFFTRDFFQATAHLGSQSITPIFIVGMPRSGTTLTEQILTSHPAIAGAGELKLIDRLRQQIVVDAKSWAGQTPSTAKYPRVLTSLDRAHVHELANQYLQQLETHRDTETHVTDKMPTNFIHLGLIALLFPKATVIHCQRNPMDVLVSCYCQSLNAPFCDLEQSVQYYHQYRRMMDHWHEHLPLKIHMVNYESLVTDPETNSRDLIEHCGLQWDDDCLRFHANERSVHTPSKWQVRQPMYSSSVEKWRRFEPHLKHIAKKFDEPLRKT